MLTYNRMNNIGVGCTERVDAGLSMFGLDVVKRCEDLGVMIDVSHCGRLTSLDACRTSSGPVNANHTSARGFYEHARGKSDDELRAIADTGGVIGVVAVPFFLSSDVNPTIEAMLNHIDYIARLVGPQSIALGTDWPLQIPDAAIDGTFGVEASKMGFRRQDNVKPTQRTVVIYLTLPVDLCPGDTATARLREYWAKMRSALFQRSAAKLFARAAWAPPRLEPTTEARCWFGALLRRMNPHVGRPSPLAPAVISRPSIGENWLRVATRVWR